MTLHTQLPIYKTGVELLLARQARRRLMTTKTNPLPPLQARVTLSNSDPKPCGDGCNGCAFCRRDDDTPTERSQVLADAMEHAEACLRARDGWTVETLGHNIESAFGMDLDADECDEIARACLGRQEGSTK